MPADGVILAIDQGTTGTAALVFDAAGQVVAAADREIAQHYPQPGWVEHDPDEILQSAVDVARSALARSGSSPADVRAIGITNQRETTIAWRRSTGRPIAPAIVWHCRRTAPLCEELRRQGQEALVRDRTGLPIDAYFSATKLRWLLDQVPDADHLARSGDLLVGTVDAWLVWNLTGRRVHATDVSNAARTSLLNLRSLAWDPAMLDLFGIPPWILPEVRPTSGDFGTTDPALFGAAIPLAGVAGDQQAALFGQACLRPGLAKNTYGTGSFLLANTGATAYWSGKGLITTAGWQIGGERTYALEGSVFITGAAVQWLRDGLGLISRADETEALAMAVPDTGGVYFVPALVGLGAPYWDMYARGTIVGLTRGTGREHLVRATLEAIAYQTRDVLDVMRGEGQIDVPVLRVDGGGSANRFLMQFQADLLGIPVEVAAVPETTALGAAGLAGLAVGFWPTPDAFARHWRPARRYEPQMSADRRETLYDGWRRAVARSRAWAQD